MRMLAVSVILMAACLASADDKKPEPRGEDVKGKVALDGKPLPAGVITFVSKDGKLKISASIADDGTYKLKLPVGEYTIGIAPPPAKKGDPKNPPNPSPIPAKYGDPKTSRLMYQVTEGQQTFDIVLTTR